MFARMRSEYLVARLNQKPPITKDEYDRDAQQQKSGKPPKIGPDAWREQAKSRKLWEEDAKAARFASISPYHFEQAMYFPDHFFDEPEIERPETPEERKARIKALDEATSRNLVQAFERFAAGG